MSKRKFHLRSYNNHHTVYEIMPGHGERAVSPCYAFLDDAKRALIVLQSTNVSRIELGFISRLVNP